MSEVLTADFLSALLAGAILAGAPLLFAGLGDTLSERAGVLNIGLEGMMLAGAYTGFVVALYSNHWIGLLGGVLAGMVISLIMVLFCVRLGLNQIVVGISILIFAQGITSVLQRAQFGTTYPRLGAIPDFEIPLLSRIPVVGDSVFAQPLILYIGLVMVLGVYYVLRHTRWGLDIRAAGEKPEALDAAGVSVYWTRSWAVIATGGFAGLGGGYMAIIGAGIFVPFMTHGMGFIGIVIAMLARGKAVWVLIGSLLFGVAVSITTALQLVGVEVPIDVVNMLPFIAVMVALVIFARQAYLPAALALPYKRE